MCMVELGQLESRHEELDRRGVRVVAASVDDLPDASATQQRFPHLTILSDKDEVLARAVQVLGPSRGPDGREVVSPTTFLIDQHGKVRWVFRPDRFITRLPADDLLRAVDEH